jgi:hypothetical protein
MEEDKNNNLHMYNKCIFKVSLVRTMASIQMKMKNVLYMNICMKLAQVGTKLSSIVSEPLQR